MVITANSGPFLGFGITATSTGQITQYNEDEGPSTFDQGSGLMDPRPFYRYTPGGGVNPNSSAAIGFSANQTMQLWDNIAYVDYVPVTANASAIALAATNTTPSAATALILAAAGSSVGAISTTLSAPESGQAASVIAIDSTAAFVEFGQSQNIAAWNPRAGTGRTIQITISGSADGGTATVAGRDMYGFKMTESIVLSTASPAIGSSNAAGYKFSGKKAFKYVSAVVTSTTVGSSAWSVGFTDTFGFPALLSYTGLSVSVTLNASNITYGASANVVAFTTTNTALGSTVATQTSTTPDVRGTYASTTASNGTLRLQMFQSFDPFIMSVTSVGASSAMFGGTQFSSV